ncbi:MAG: hypothetical protein Q7V57_17135 [Actinomycetota bacterium]|nr:hypothetical protein [Actinomycetota bacterium]
MRRSDKSWMEYEEASKPFLSPESDEATASIAAELRERMQKVEQQVLAQYTATAAYATLGQQAVDQARAESRSDLDRLQTTIIGLLDRLRADFTARLDGVDAGRGFATPDGSLSGDVADAVNGRLGAMEDRINGLIRALEGSVHENMVLRQQIEELQQRVMKQDGWLVSNGGPSDLSLG